MKDKQPLSLNSVNFVLGLAKNRLAEKRKILKKQQNDSECPIKMYNKTLESCKKIEYTIKELEDLL